MGDSRYADVSRGPIAESDKSAYANNDPQDLPLKLRMLVFAHIILLQILVNYDSGAIAASLENLSAPEFPGFNLSLTESGLLSSLVYMGLSVASLIAAPLLNKFQPKLIIFCTLVVNVLANVMFAWAQDKHTLLASRFLVGASQSALVVYAPIWVDEFAPEASCTLWMSLMQAGVPLGVMSGYLVSGLLTAYRPELDPRWPFRIQVFMLAPIVLLLLLVPGPYINTKLSYHQMEEFVEYDVTEDHVDDHLRSARVDTFDVNEIRSVPVWEQIGHLASNPVYLFTVLALSALYFVVTGIQLWITVYLVQYIMPLYGGFTKSQVVYAFAVTSATGPILGVLFGGWMTDKIGGYRGHRGVRDAARLATGFGVLALACAIPVMFATKLVWIIVLIWWLLFWGGAILPPAVGIIMSCVPRHMRSFSSGASTLFYNWLGYFLGPTLSGFVSDMCGGVEWGMRLIFAWSGFGFLFMVLAWTCAHWRYIKHKRDETLGLDVGEEEDDEFDMLPQKSEVEYEMARERRLSLIIQPSRATSPSAPLPVLHRSRITRSDTNLLRGTNSLGRRYGSLGSVSNETSLARSMVHGHPPQAESVPEES